MKRIFFLLMSMPILLMACTKQQSASQSSSTAYQEPEWANIDIESISDKDDWLHASDAQLSDPLARQLVEAYNYSVVWRNLYTDLDLSWRMWWNNSDVGEINSLYDAIISMDCFTFSDPKMAHLADSLKHAVALAVVDSTSKLYEQYFDRYMGAVLNYYDSFHVASESYNEDEEPYATYVQNYAELQEKRMQSDSIHQQQLLSMIDSATDMNRRCVYAIEYAHSSQDGPYFIDAIPVLVNIMNTGEYSPFLYDVWRTWRTMQAAHMGMSRDSAIPNLQYNALRRTVANTMLNHIIEHPDDAEAIRAFLYLSACANINRYCDFPFGNQNFEEQMVIFPEFVYSIIGD